MKVPDDLETNAIKINVNANVHSGSYVVKIVKFHAAYAPFYLLTSDAITPPLTSTLRAWSVPAELSQQQALLVALPLGPH